MYLLASVGHAELLRNFSQDGWSNMLMLLTMFIDTCVRDLLRAVAFAPTTAKS
jgi:hypothetical protein